MRNFIKYAPFESYLKNTHGPNFWLEMDKNTPKI